MHFLREIRKLLAVCALLLESTVCQEVQMNCGDLNQYKPKRLTDPNAHLHSVMIVTTKPTPIVLQGTGSLIHPKWVLSVANKIQNRWRQFDGWGVMGARMDRISLQEGHVYPLVEVVEHPYHNVSNSRSAFDLALLKVEGIDTNQIVPIAVASKLDVDKIDKLEVVYWKEGDDGLFSKYVKTFCTEVRKMRTRCALFKREVHLCLSGDPTGEKPHPDAPCFFGVKSVGCAVIAWGQVVGVFMGIENTLYTGELYCYEPKDPNGKEKPMFYYVAHRVLQNYDPESPELGKVADWLNTTIAGIYEHSTIFTTEGTTAYTGKDGGNSTADDGDGDADGDGSTTVRRPRLTPKTVWQYCVKANAERFDLRGWRLVLAVAGFSLTLHVSTVWRF